jgi:hypothetical protein
MADRGNLAALTGKGLLSVVELQALHPTMAVGAVTMAKHPSHLQLEGTLRETLERYVADTANSEPCVLWKGPVRDLCPLAPNNVNTMACGALAAHNLSFDKTVGGWILSLHSPPAQIRAD